MPLGENMSAVGEWGPLVGACFALFGTVMKKVVDRMTIATTSAAEVELADSAPTEVAIPDRICRDGVCRGRGLNDLSLGIKWDVRDGHLRRDEIID